jgi:hypothetical protein
VLKKSGILLAVLVLSTFTLAVSAFLLTLAPHPAAAPAEATTGLEWLAVDGPGKPMCRCTTSAQCGGSVCCWWAGQKCGICCN